MIDFIVLKWVFFTVSRPLYVYFCSFYFVFAKQGVIFVPLLVEVMFKHKQSGPKCKKVLSSWCLSLLYYYFCFLTLLFGAQICSFMIMEYF